MDLSSLEPALSETVQEGSADDEVAVIVRLAEDEELPGDVRVVTRFGDIATLRLARSRIPELLETDAVAALEARRRLRRSAELPFAAEDGALDGPDPETRRPPGVRGTGRGVVVGVLDWGCDFAHPAFRDEDGSTRLLALWDQRGGRSENRFGYGRVHSADDIDRALAEPDPYAALGYDPSHADEPDHDRGGWKGAHGTHVLDIAAGSGRGVGAAGVAPEADLVFVHLSRTTPVLGRGNLGDSVTVLEGLDFVFSAAGDRPCVVNMSIGAHGGPHDGTTLVEQGIDRALWLADGRAVVQSAGNYQTRRAHARGRVAPGGERVVRFRVPAGDPTDSEIELFYESVDRFTVTVIGPDGEELAELAPGADSPLRAGGDVVGHAYHFVRQPTSGDHHVDVFLRPCAPGGTWGLRLRGDRVADGHYHAWIERDRGLRPEFVDEDDGRSTTGTLCNGRFSVTVGAYDPFDGERALGSFSSSGPTRDGRVKPELVAPGVGIRAARSTPPESAPAELYVRKAGTSMAAPHVTGTVALMFEAAGRPLEIADTRALLFSSVECAPQIGPDFHRLGYGYLDIAAAEAAAAGFARGGGVEEVQETPSSTVGQRALPVAQAADSEQIQTAGCRCGATETAEGIPMRQRDAGPEGPSDFQDSYESRRSSDLADLLGDGRADPGDDGGEPDGLPDVSDGWGPSFGESLRECASSGGSAGCPVALHRSAFELLGVEPQAALAELGARGSVLGTSVQPGDLLVRRGLHAGSVHSAVVVGERLEAAHELARRGVPVERAGPGGYAEVLEVPFGGGRPQVVGRRLTDAWGRVPRNSAVFRPRGEASSTGSWSSAPVASFEESVLLAPAARLERPAEQAAPPANWCAIRAAIAPAARTELARWRDPAGNAILESAASQLPILTQYWSAVPGLPVPAATAAAHSAADHPHFPWSAAFICFVMRAAGVQANHGFVFGPRHLTYIVGALRNRERSDRSRPFWLVDRIEVQNEALPEPGDLLCFNRCRPVPNAVPDGCPPGQQRTAHSYESLRRRFWLGGHQNVVPHGSSHCSLVVGTRVQGGVTLLETIGGNETNSVRLRANIPLNAAGGIANPQAHHIFGMIKLIGC